MLRLGLLGVGIALTLSQIIAFSPKGIGQAAKPLESSLERTLGHYRVRLVSRAYDVRLDKGVWWGGSESVPKRVVVELEVWYKGRSVPVRNSAFAGLAETHRLALTSLPDRMNLTIEGGDAADGYTCRVEFRNGAVTGRTVEYAEFPDHVFETTKFVSKPIID